MPLDNGERKMSNREKVRVRSKIKSRSKAKPTAHGTMPKKRGTIAKAMDAAERFGRALSGRV